jgi:hypothetical protein
MVELETEILANGTVGYAVISYAVSTDAWTILL